MCRPCRETYPGIPVVKYECAGHAEKRVGCRLRKLKENIKGLSELTGNIIDLLQNITLELLFERMLIL